MKHHPDRNPGDEEAVERFKEAAEAFEVLSHADKRARYDRFGHAGLEGPGGGAPQFHDVGDIFEAFLLYPNYDCGMRCRIFGSLSCEMRGRCC